ncbi:MAG: hypothetical protein OEZ08_00920 [Betaproteobacteria bacterium]|nr:hypothetical protein [Betaproteobacteria bacterium]
MHASGARRALEKIGHGLRLHRKLRRQLVHARRLRAIAFEERRELLPQRFVPRREHRAMTRQAQARAVPHQATGVDEKIDRGHERRADVGRARPDRFRMRGVPLAYGTLQRVALRVPALFAHDVAYAAHFEVDQPRCVAERNMERLFEPFHVQHAVREKRVADLLRVEARDSLAPPRAACGRQRIGDPAGAYEALRARVAQQQPVVLPCAHAVRKGETGEAPERRQARLEHGRAQVHPDRSGTRNRRPEPRHFDVEKLRHGNRPGVGDHVAAPDFVPRDAVQRKRAALACPRALRRTAIRPEAAHARLAARGQHLHVVPGGDRARSHGASDDEAEAVDDECTVDVHAKALS